jgi:hypothetical protein
MNFAVLLKAFDAALMFGDAVRRLKKGDAPPPAEAADTRLASLGSEAAGTQLEARLTNVIVAALKEAFDRDHARLELERAEMEEQRRRADEARRLERRRQAIEGELARMRLLVGAALVGWIVAVLLVAGRLDDASSALRVTAAGGWLLLIGASGAAFIAQRHVSAGLFDGRPMGTRWAGTALALFVGGLALSTLTLLL